MKRGCSFEGIVLVYQYQILKQNKMSHNMLECHFNREKVWAN